MTEGIGDGTRPYPGWPKEVRAEARAGGSKRKNKRGHRKLPHTPIVSLTSLTDMVTLLLVYLLKTFATNPIEVKEPSIELPRSTCAPDANAPADLITRDGCGNVEETTIVMITGPVLTRTVDNRQVQQAAVPRIIVDGKPVVELDPATYRIPEAQKDAQSGGYVVLPLKEALRKAKEIKEVTSQLTGATFDGKVVILADRQTPYRVLTDVLVTCGESGFADFRFAVIRPEG